MFVQLLDSVRISPWALPTSNPGGLYQIGAHPPIPHHPPLPPHTQARWPEPRRNADLAPEVHLATHLRKVRTHTHTSATCAHMQFWLKAGLAPH